MIIELCNMILTFLYGAFFTIIYLDLQCSRKNRAFIILYCALSLSAQLAVFFTFSADAVYSFYPLLVHIPLLLVLIFGCRCKPLPAAASLFMSYFLTIPRYFLGSVLMLCFPGYITTISLGRVIATIPLAVIFYFFSVRPIRAALKRPYRDIRIFAVPLFITYAFPYAINTYTDLIDRYPTLVIDAAVIVFFAFIINFLYLYFCTYDRNIELSQRTQLLSVSAHALEKQIDSLRQSQEDTRILRHDERHFASLIEGYAREGNTDAILRYVSSINERLDEVTPLIYCKNEAVNLILSSYLAPFSNDHLPVGTSIKLTDENFIADIDLCIILANALENAYHAVSGISDPFLRIKLSNTTDQFFIKIDNKCLSGITFQDGMPVSTISGHGYGTRSIVAIVKKYNGIYSFEETDGVFTFQAVLHRPGTLTS